MYFNSFTFVPRKKSEVVIKNGQSRETGTTRHNTQIGDKQTIAQHEKLKR